MSVYRPLFRVLNASGTRYVVVGGDDLIHLKRLAGRPQDREDVAKLEEIRRLRVRMATNAETNEVAGQDERWVASWDAVRQAQLEAGLAATAEQRLDWLEDAMRLAEASGALARRRGRSARSSPSAIG